MIEIKSKTELENILSQNDGKLVILKCWAPWCGPCKVLGKTLEEIEPTLENVTIAECNIEDADEDFVGSLGVRNIPFLAFYKDKGIVDKFVGAISKDSLIARIEENKKK